MVRVDRESRFAQAHTTRRNIMAIGAIAGAAIVARARTANAKDKEKHDEKEKQHGRTSACSLKCTKTQTPFGERNIEEWALGGELPPVFGGMRPIQWIGHYRYQKSDPSKPWGKHALPVRVARSALAPDVPHADLVLSQGHALYIDGALVQVGGL